MSAVPFARHRAAPSWLRPFLADEARAWVFVAKALFAMYFGAWLAMRLQFSQPSTTMITVAIVMHPKSGMVLAKGFYRAIGTLVGSAAGLALIALFPQQRELFLLGLSLWVGLCAGGAMLYRNFMAYGFVLAGYTAAIVTLPVIADPLQAFHSAQARLSEVLLGIVVSTVVSDVVLPERLRAALRQAARKQFGDFVAFVRDSAGGAIARDAMESAHLAVMRAAVQVEDLRASVIFEDPEVRTRSRRMRLLNHRYMAAATSFQSVHHLINRLQRSDRADAADALVRLYQPLAPALATDQPEADVPQTLVSQLDAAAVTMRAAIPGLRFALSTAASQREFDTGAALLLRFTDELRDYAATEAALRLGVTELETERVHFRRNNDVAGAALAALRTFLTMVVLSAFWLASGWSYGANAMLMATVFAGLMAALPNPVGAVVRTIYGFLAGIAVGAVVTFFLLPGSDGYGMLIAASLPLLLVGPYMITRPSVAGLGVGYTMGFVLNLSVSNPMVFDPQRYFNGSLSEIAGLAASAAAFMLLPGLADTGRLQRRLRELVVQAATAPLDSLAWRFESSNRDLTQQAMSKLVPRSAAARSVLAWSLAVQETGRLLIELRQDVAAEPLDAAFHAHAGAAVQAVAALYAEPDTARWQAAVSAVDAALDTLAGHAVHGARNHLHQLRSALRDTESPLAAIMPAAPEVIHAA